MRFCLIPLLVFGIFTARTMAQQGEWGPVLDFGPSELDAIAPVHLIHLHTGKVIAVIEADPGLFPYPGNHFNYLWTPPQPNDFGNGTFESIPNTHNSQFCVGHSALADGRILFAGSQWSYWAENEGSHPSLPRTDFYDPLYGPNFVSPWNFPMAPPDMDRGRWYPTCTTLPDGKVLVMSGTEGRGENPHNWIDIPELFDPANPIPEWVPLMSAERNLPRYPYMFVLPDGNLFNAGPGLWTHILDRATWTWGTFAPPPQPWPALPPYPPYPSEGGSVVMYEPGKIMKCGGIPLGSYEAQKVTWFIDLNGADLSDPPTWLPADNMRTQRMNHNLVILADGKVLALGGNERVFSAPPLPFHHNHLDPIDPVYTAEIYDPVAGTWTEQPESNDEQPRMYHSTAMLLRDGRVVSAGGDGSRTFQIFKPPYIVDGAPRPQIVAAPTYMQYGQQYSVTFTSSAPVTHACLIRLASVTHGLDHDQRRVPLTVTDNPGPLVPTILIDAPANANLAPPGYYMLFILYEYARNKFVPCEMAAYVQIGP